jgi:hypothetical protein
MARETLDHLLEQCLQEVEQTGDIEEVLRHHPDRAEQLRPLLELASTVREQYTEVPEPPARLREGLVRLRRETLQARGAVTAEHVAAHRHDRRSTMRLRLVPTLISVALIVAVGLAGTGGVALAADASAPGDPLYGLDRTMERLQLRLTYSPEAATQLRLNLTEERMGEIQELIRRQDQERLGEALGGYSEAVAALTDSPEGREVLGDPARMAHMNQVLAQHEEQLQYAFQSLQGQESDDGEEGEETDLGKNGREGDGWWTDGRTHPVVDRLVSTYDDGITSTDVISWFASGYGFGEIMHALETSKNLSGTETITGTIKSGVTITITDTSPAGLLRLKAELGGWGQVWQALGLIGKGKPDDSTAMDEAESMELEDSEDEDKGGPPDHAGPKDKDKDKDKRTGPPDHAGPKDRGDGGSSGNGGQ